MHKQFIPIHYHILYDLQSSLHQTIYHYNIISTNKLRLLFDLELRLWFKDFANWAIWSRATHANENDHQDS